MIVGSETERDVYTRALKRMFMTAANSLCIPNKRWVRIIPPTIIIYIIAYMDRMNISFAIAGGMNKSLGLSMTSSGLAAGIFFFGYLLLQLPAGHIAEHGSDTSCGQS
jgi:sugar phosphate permease